MILKLINAESREVIGQISQAEIDFLVDLFEEESLEDATYFVNQDTIDMVEVRGGDPDLIARLRQAVAGSDGIEITWEAS